MLVVSAENGAVLVGGGGGVGQRGTVCHLFYVSAGRGGVGWGGAWAAQHSTLSAYIEIHHTASAIYWSFMLAKPTQHGLYCTTQEPTCTTGMHLSYVDIFKFPAIDHSKIEVAVLFFPCSFMLREKWPGCFINYGIGRSVKRFRQIDDKLWFFKDMNVLLETFIICNPTRD